MGDEFFLYKIYALFHDSPHKMTVEMRKNGGNFFRKNFGTVNECSSSKMRAHECEALIMLYNLILRDLRNKPSDFCKIYKKNSKTKVHKADVLASEYNRWVLNYLYINNTSMSFFNYSNFHNLFNPLYYTEVNYDISPKDLKEFTDKFKEITSGVISVLNNGNISNPIKYLYFLIYTIYEPLWIYYNLPVGVEDSRAPYYTIFDHLYASASIINWVYYAKNTYKPKGFYVVIDIPGVQEIINSARKASDYWAGSWMLSMIVWLTVWQLIKEYGPDVLLAPTARFNPLYYAMVLNYLQSNGIINDEVRKKIEDVLNTILGEISGIYDYKYFIKEAIIPATVSLILPKEPGYCSIKIENKILEYYRRAYNCIVKELPTGNVSSELCEEFVHAFNISLVRDNNKFDIVIQRLVKMAETYADRILIRPAIYVMDIDEIGDEIEADLKDKGVCNILNTQQIEKVKSQYVFHYITTKLYREKIKERYKKEILPKPEWFYSFKRDFEYKSENWEYCTVCGNEPAIFDFTKKNNEDEYSDFTKEEILKLAQLPKESQDELFKGLKIWFKPGEKLGPLCIIKRGLYYTLRQKLKVFRSTDDVAYSYYKEVIQPEIKDLDECRDLKAFLSAEESDVYAKFGNPVEARKKFSICTEIDDKKLSYIQKDYEVSEVNRAFKDAIRGYREFYAIIKADVDNMTETVRAEIKAEKYLDVLPKLLKYGDFEESLQRRSPKSRQCRSLIYTYMNMVSVANTINEGYVLMTPTYRVALSTAMILTLLRDIKTVEVDNHGQIIYAGGDDLVALVPIDRLIDTLIGLEENFVGKDGFFHVRNWYIHAISPNGRSFSVRIANIADFMTSEIQRATELLNKVKKVRWVSVGEAREKFSVIFSSSRSNYESILPMWDYKYLRLLKKMWTLNLSNILSSSVYEDYEKGFKELVDGIANNRRMKESTYQLLKLLINYVLIRNNGKNLTSDFEIENKVLEVSDYKSNIFNEIFKAFRIMRGVL
ncbi:type III-B CRISPR-associated protein Cas10/Cmr2 [Saccharolobus shibatae]|uniref:CRISPR-associated RAMP Cmr2 n=1 Tax=Saccharolobus shibatae TaxID=2286 RepID=A0A8F5GZA7_9CREN|nr:type III-B CRISPR-associated protein Cas10/Cmr2 [Saccharolobus shibatae]QXJ31900.1 CRISPR-associated RAMP Cmr2 [Saccharolobus shibatae]QXJ34906.1 CRISPR-associated RAMP Cmr2 [Saccharolobus shibatae]